VPCAHCEIRERGLLADLDAEQVALIRRPIQAVALDRGAILYRAGVSADFLYTVRSGLVKLVHYLPDGTQRIVRLPKRGDIFSLGAILELPYQHHASVPEPVLVCRVPVDVVRQLEQQTPLQIRQLFSRLQYALEESDGWLRELVTGTPPGPGGPHADATR
jgi:CRP-like cAMP-binding protein